MRTCRQGLPPPIPWHRAVKQLAGGQTSFSPKSNMSLVQQPQMQITPHLDTDIPHIDLEGGTLESVEQKEEIDSDGVRKVIYTFNIKTPDNWLITRTITKKMKVDMTSVRRSIMVTNGVEASVEEQRDRLRGDIRGLGPLETTSSRSRMHLDPACARDFTNQLMLNPSDPKDLAIQDVLEQVPDTFRSLLSRRQESLMKMFPELFSQMRTKSTLIPSTATEIITNPDGSTTTCTRSSKSYSHSYSSQETYVNGVRQEAMSKSRFRAFVEYKGPDCGFRMNLSNDATEDLSEDETEDDDTHSKIYSETASEITDNESEMLHPGQHSVHPESKKRFEKAWFAAKELVDSEQRYVDKLNLLAKIFREKIVAEKVLDRERQNKLFANIDSLYQFHNTHFLPQLLEASREWHTTKRIANVVRKQAPFLKMYSEYTNNYDRATKVFEEAKRKRRFAEIVAEIERLPDCEGLPLQHHLICPVQRVMRYQLLLQEYKKHTAETDVDYEDTAVALDLVLQAATHANEMMKRLEGFGKVIEVQEELNNSISLVSPGRELIRRGTIQKLSSTTEKTEERTIFLFNDLILLASERSFGLAKYKLRAVFHPLHTQVCEGDNLEREHSFYLRGSDGNGPQRCVELFCETQQEKQDWVEAICGVIDESTANSATFGSSERSSIGETTSQAESKHCADCDAEFSLWSRGIKCGKCRRKLCKKCFGRYRTESKNNRVCEPCVKNKIGDGVRRSQSMFSAGRQNLLAVPATGDGVLHGGWVKFRGSMNKTFQRYLAVREDFCMYSYVNPTDSQALLMLPLPGCEVRMCGEPFTFSLRVGARRDYKISCDSEESQTHWMALLDLAANAQLKA